MKTSNTIVAFCLALAAFFLALAAGSSAAPGENPGPKELYHPRSKKYMPNFSLRSHRTLQARSPQPTNPSRTAGSPVENTAAPAKNTGPKDLSHPHWKKPIPIFSQRSHRTLEATRTLEARDDPTVGPGGVTSLPSDVTYSFGVGYHFSSVKAHTPIGWWPPYATYMPPLPPMPTTPVCDGLRHPEQYSYEKCMVAMRRYEDDTKRRSDDWKLQMENGKAATEEAHRKAKKKYKEEEEERKKEEEEKTKKRLDEERRAREEVEIKKEEAEKKKKKKEAQERVAEEDEREAKVEVEKKREEEEKKKKKEEEKKKKEEEEKKKGKNFG